MSTYRARIALTIGLLAGWSWTEWARRTGLAPGTIRSAWRGDANPRTVTVVRLEIAVSTLSSLRRVAADLWGGHNDWPAVEAAAVTWRAA